MPVFVSHVNHSPEDRDVLDNLLASLKAARIQDWHDRTRLAAGGSVNAQIRRGALACEVCLFIATPASIRSPWCLMELGAFWGRGRPILTLLSSGLTRADLLAPDVPHILRETLVTASVAKVVEDLRVLLPTSDGSVGQPDGAEYVGDVHVSRLREIVQIALEVREQDVRLSLDRFLLELRALSVVPSLSTPPPGGPANLPTPVDPLPAVVSSGIRTLSDQLFRVAENTVRRLYPFELPLVRATETWQGFFSLKDGDTYADGLALRLVPEGITGEPVIRGAVRVYGGGVGVAPTFDARIAVGWPGPTGWKPSPDPAGGATGAGHAS